MSSGPEISYTAVTKEFMAQFKSDVIKGSLLCWCQAYSALPQQTVINFKPNLTSQVNVLGDKLRMQKGMKKTSTYLYPIL